MKEVFLALPPGYDKTTQATVGLFAAQLDDQSVRLKKAVAGFGVQHLEWQHHPGMNTVGMLLTHLAGVEIWWINVAAAELPWQPEGERILNQILGYDSLDDGIPLKEDGTHPTILKGKNLEEYFAMLDKARAAIHGNLRKWKDSDLDRKFKLRDEEVTRSWTLYHVLEHFAGHFGQILLLRHMMRDIGLLEKPAKKV